MLQHIVYSTNVTIVCHFFGKLYTFFAYKALKDMTYILFFVISRRIFCMLS